MDTRRWRQGFCFSLLFLSLSLALSLSLHSQFAPRLLSLTLLRCFHPGSVHPRAAAAAAAITRCAFSEFVILSLSASFISSFGSFFSHFLPFFTLPPSSGYTLKIHARTHALLPNKKKVFVLCKRALVYLWVKTIACKRIVLFTPSSANKQDAV